MNWTVVLILLGISLAVLGIGIVLSWEPKPRQTTNVFPLRSTVRSLPVSPYTGEEYDPLAGLEKIGMNNPQNYGEVTTPPGSRLAVGYILRNQYCCQDMHGATHKVCLVSFHLGRYQGIIPIPRLPTTMRCSSGHLIGDHNARRRYLGQAQHAIQQERERREYQVVVGQPRRAYGIADVRISKSLECYVAETTCTVHEHPCLWVDWVFHLNGEWRVVLFNDIFKPGKVLEDGIRELLAELEKEQVGDKPAQVPFWKEG